MQNRSEPVHSVRCLELTLPMDSVVLIQNSYGSLFHVSWVGNKAPNLYLQLCLVIIVVSYMESKKYCTALLSPFICCCCCCWNISKNKNILIVQTFGICFTLFRAQRCLTTEGLLVIICGSRCNNNKLCSSPYGLFICIPIILTINSDYLVFHH